MENERFRFYNLREKTYVGWAGRRLTRKAFSEISKIPIPTLKQIETRGVRPRPATLARLAACQVAMGANLQAELLGDAAVKSAARAAAKAERERDKWLDKMLRAARRPLSKKAKQGSIFN